MPSKPSQTTYKQVILWDTSIFFQQLVSLTLLLEPRSHKRSPIPTACLIHSSVLDLSFNLIFFFFFFAPADASLQQRPVVSRQYYTLPNNGASVERRPSAPPVNANVDSPRFHPHAKGKNIRLDGQLRRATRKNSFCNGITFSHRPVHLYEKVCFVKAFQFGLLHCYICQYGSVLALPFPFTDFKESCKARRVLISTPMHAHKGRPRAISCTDKK